MVRSCMRCPRTFQYREELPEIQMNDDAIANAKSEPVDRRTVFGCAIISPAICMRMLKLEPSSASILDATDDFSIGVELPAQFYKRYVDLIRRTYPDKWQSMLEDLFRNSSGKFTSECINFMLEHELNERISFCLNRWLNDQTIKGPLLFWVVKNRNSKKYGSIIQPLVSPRLLSAMFYAIDYESLQNASTRRIPLADLLSDDDELIPDLADASVETARDLAQTCCSIKVSRI